MLTHSIRSVLTNGVALALTLLLGGAAGGSAQLRDLGVTTHVGAAIPFGQFADYVSGGPAFGIQVEYPVREPVDLIVNADLDLMNGHPSYGLPDLRLFRYQAGLEADLLGRSSASWGLRGQLGAGATSFRSKDFFLAGTPEAQRFRHTYFTGSAGLKFVFGSGPIHGYVGSRLHWAPMKEEDTAVLRQVALGPRESLDTALSAPISLGLRIRS